MRIRQFDLLLLIWMAWLLFGCVPAVDVVTPSSSIEFAPTAIPPTPAPTVTLNPLTPTMLPPNVWKATVSARATASPFPTAGVVAIKPGERANAAVQRDGLSFSVELPKDSVLAGEGGPASVTLRSDGAQTLFIHGDGRDAARLVILDEQGHNSVASPRKITMDPLTSGCRSRQVPSPYMLQCRIHHGA